MAFNGHPHIHMFASIIVSKHAKSETLTEIDTKVASTRGCML